ncbi:MAG: hypothetical protein ACRDGW_11590 [Actinomycetota bacterium]
MRTSALLMTALLLAACADTPPAAQGVDGEATPDVGRIVCEADGSTSVFTPEVLARRDGVHLVVDNRLDEPASLIGGFGFDVDPGVSEWTLQTAPGDRAVACWPFSDHGSGDEPDTIPFQVLDPDGMYVPPAELECPDDLQWATILDFIDVTTGFSNDPVEAVRQSIRGLQPGDAISLSRSGYPAADTEGEGTVVVDRDGRAVAIFGVTLADDGRWLVSGGRGCATVGIDFS